MKQERIQKLLAQAGHGSRREIETWLAQGRVTVNGKVAGLGDKAWPADHIQLDGKSITMSTASDTPRTIAYHKPEGEVVTRRDPEGRPTVFALLPRLRAARWVAIGRLDLNTSGLLLLTTDGELASRLMHPGYELEREYAVRVLGEVSPAVLEHLRRGVELEDGPAHFDEIIDAGGSGANHWYHVVLKEGRKREVRRLWESQGLRVSRLIRVRFGDVRLGRSLRPGRWRDLDAEELASLYRTAGLPVPVESGRRAGRDDRARPRARQPEVRRGEARGRVSGSRAAQDSDRAVGAKSASWRRESPSREPGDTSPWGKRTGGSTAQGRAQRGETDPMNATRSRSQGTRGRTTLPRDEVKATGGRKPERPPWPERASSTPGADSAADPSRPRNQRVKSRRGGESDRGGERAGALKDDPWRSGRSRGKAEPSPSERRPHVPGKARSR